MNKPLILLYFFFLYLAFLPFSGCSTTPSNGSETNTQTNEPSTLKTKTDIKKSDTSPHDQKEKKSPKEEKQTGKQEIDEPKKVEENDFVVNLLWLFRDKDSLKNNTLIMPKVYKRKVAKTNDVVAINTIDVACTWAKKGSLVRLWYDGDLVPNDAVTNTQSALASGCSEHAKNIKLKNVKDLSVFANFPKAFGWVRYVSMYYALDLIRMIIVYEDLKIGNLQYSVYSDFSIPPISSQKLFDADTKAKLNIFGFVFSKAASGSIEPYENGFMIFHNDPPILRALKTALIDNGIFRAMVPKYYLSKERDQDVYKMLQAFFRVAYHLKAGLPLLKDKDYPLVETIITKQNSNDIQNATKNMFFDTADSFPNVAQIVGAQNLDFASLVKQKQFLNFIQLKTVEVGSETMEYGELIIPTKDVNAPLSNFVK